MPVHPVIQRAMVRAYRHGHGQLSEKSVHQVRQYFEYRNKSVLERQLFEEHRQNPDTEIRIFRPLQLQNQNRPLPVVIYLRACGYVLTDLEQASKFCYHLAQILQCHVVAIAPGISPEHKFPVPFQHCVDAVNYLHQRRHALNLDFSRVCLWGESSGGNMAAALSHYFNQRQPNFILHQILFYPMLDYTKQTAYPSKHLYGSGYMMENSLSDWMLGHYVVSQDDYHDERVSPLLAGTFSHLPNTLLISAEYDPMRDEGYAYVQKLHDAGVDVHSVTVPGLIHGFMWYLPSVDRVQQVVLFAARYLIEQILDQNSVSMNLDWLKHHRADMGWSTVAESF